MKYYILIALLLIIPIVVCAEQITLRWDPPEGDIDGVRIYRNTEGNYNYDQPMTTEAYPNGDIPPDVNQLVVDLPGRPDEAVKYSFVARAYRGDRMSADSNEVEYTVVRIPPPAPENLSGQYIPDESLIRLTYEQTADDWDIHHWILYYRLEGGDYVPLGGIDKGQELKLEAPFDAVAPGEKATVYFTVTAYRRSGVFSQNSAELELEIDRTVVNPPQNFRIDLEIPVG